MFHVKDVLYIKSIERKIRRKLDDLELEVIHFGEPLILLMPDGYIQTFYVPLYCMPTDLMPSFVVTPEDERRTKELYG